MKWAGKTLSMGEAEIALESMSGKHPSIGAEGGNAPSGGNEVEEDEGEATRDKKKGKKAGPHEVWMG